MAADTAFFQGIIDTPQRLAALQMQFTLSQLITAGVLLALVQCSRRVHQGCASAGHPVPSQHCRSALQVLSCSWVLTSRVRSVWGGSKDVEVLRLAGMCSCSRPWPSTSQHSLRGLQPGLRGSDLECWQQTCKLAQTNTCHCSVPAVSALQGAV